MAKLTEHFTLEEMTKTSTNLKNVPSEAQVANLKRLCGWLERLRSRYNELSGKVTPGGLRQRKRWFAPKHYASVMRLKDDMARLLAEDFIGTITEVLGKQ